MKKFFIGILLAIIALNGYSQRGGAPNWISIAAKGCYGNSVFFCKQATDIDGFNINYLAPSYGFGGRLGVVFIDRVGASVEYLSSQYQGKYDYNNSIIDLEGTLKMKASDLLLLFRYTGEYGFYCELGPKFTSVKDVTRDVETPDNSGKLKGPKISSVVKDDFKDKFTSVVFGFGFMPYNGDRVQISLGIRAAYCGKSVVNDDQNDVLHLVKPMTIEMKPFSAQAVLEVNYHFARFGSATCGKQKIIFFK